MKDAKSKKKYLKMRINVFSPWNIDNITTPNNHAPDIF